MLGLLTGAVDGSGNPLVFSTSVSTTDLTNAIVNAITTTTTQPVDIGLTPTTLPAHLSFSAAPTVVSGVAPGGTATFDVTLTGDGSPVMGTLDINFVDVHSDATLGTIPVTITCATTTPPTVTPPTVPQTSVEGALQSFNLGSFTDSGPGPWTADVKWGDGQDTTFSTTPGSLGLQSHTYGEEGPYTATVTVTDTGDGLTGSASFGVTVSDAALTGVTTATATGGVEGVTAATLSGATFTDANTSTRPATSAAPSPGAMATPPTSPPPTSRAAAAATPSAGPTRTAKKAPTPSR